MSEEQAPICPICGQELIRTEDGDWECVNQGVEKRLPEFKKLFSGDWLNYKNIDISVRWQNKDITKNPPVCDFCGAAVSAKEIKQQIGRSSISLRAYQVNRSGEYHEKLGELYEQIKEKKLNLEEAFENERLLNDKYLPKTSQESFVAVTTGNVPIDCPKCKKRLGIVQVLIKAKPETSPETPSIAEYVKLDLTKEQERLAREHFEIKDTIEKWLEAADLTSFMKELEAIRETIRKLPYMRLALREINDFNAKTYTLIETLQREMSTRSDQLYDLLKNPPLPRISPTAKMLEAEDRIRKRRWR
jgi:hypothetical protein